MNVQLQALKVMIETLQALGFSSEFIAEQVRRFHAEAARH
jgi:Holliday junction resolvasome RuvABC DNA-binding subunit